MNRRKFLGFIVAGASTAVLGKSVEALLPQPRRPNIILVTADEVGMGDLGCYGNSCHDTGNIDFIAASGMKFTDFHAVGPAPGPARVGLVTGQYPQRSGIVAAMAENHRQPGLTVNKITFGSDLKAQGYVTGIAGNWGSETISYRENYFSHIDLNDYEKNIYTSAAAAKHADYEIIADAAVRFIKENRSKQFCIYLPFSTAGVSLPAGQEISHRMMIAQLNRAVGRITAAVKETGLENDTFIFFCSTCGAKESKYNYPLRAGKYSLWEGGQRVPAIGYWPGHIKPHSVCDQLTSMLDVYPTILAMAQTTPHREQKLDGMNLLETLTRGKRLDERMMFWAYSGSWAVRQGDWKLIFNRGDSYKGLFLFNMEQDVEEKHNLYTKETLQVKKMMTLYERWYQDFLNGYNS